MKKLLLFFLLLVFPTQVFAGDFHPEANPQLESDKFWADVTFSSNSTSTLTEFRVWFEAPPEKVFPVLIDTNNFPKVHGNYHDAAVLPKAAYDAIVTANPKDVDALTPLIANKKIPSESGRVQDGQWTRYEYVNFNFPWPLSNRWSVQKVTLDETHAGEGRYLYAYEMAVGNFKALKGRWELLPVTGHANWTEFRGSYESDPGIPLPKFVTRSATKSGLKRDVDDNRKILLGK